jgi:glutamine synthetase
VENREAALRLVPGSTLVGAANANIELKPSDASANPYLAIAAVLAAGLGGIEDGLTPPEPVAQDPGTWTEHQRAERGIAALPSTMAEQLDALMTNKRIRTALGEELADAFRAVREADVAWAAERTDAEVLAAHRWLY